MFTPLQPGVRYLTDSGLETTLLFLENHPLPAFAAFVLLDQPEGRTRLDRYFREHADLARQNKLGFLFETPTWRANTDWGRTVGYGAEELHRINGEAVLLCRQIEADYHDIPTLVSAQVGPRGDGYVPGTEMTPEEAEAYHSPQIAAFGAPDLVTALTMNTVGEATGIVRAARTARLPVAISFTVETDGRLATGVSLADAILQTDEQTDGYASHFMINCAHPRHFEAVIDETVAKRVRGLRANASTLSHAELDAMETLDIGDPDSLGTSYGKLRSVFDDLAVVGGCCGTDVRHIHAIASATRGRNPRTG